MNHSVGCACIEGSCKVAATECSKVPSVPMSSSGFARGMPRGPTAGTVMSLEVEPTFLARVSNATWHDDDVEMRKIARHARGSYALFHMKQLHSFNLVYRGSGESARLGGLPFVGNCC